MLNPAGLDGRESKADTNPDKYLRSFSYGKTSTMADGTVLRQYTIVADDKQTIEISPGVYYNAWTFNGTISGPTIRATEGDLIRVHLINNGTKPHSMHFHGIHRAGMDSYLLIQVGRGSAERIVEEFG